MNLCGAPCFTVSTDHKPLEYISKKTQPPVIIERWGLRLQPYKMNIVYKPGKDNPSDYLSRHPLKNVGNNRNLAKEYVNFITEKAVPNAMTLDEVKLTSVNDTTIQKAIELTENGKWHDIQKLNYSEINKEELSALRSVKYECTLWNSFIA